MLDQFAELRRRARRPRRPCRPSASPPRRTSAAGPARVRRQTPRVEVLFDNGAGTAGAGDPESTYTAGLRQWPPPGTVDVPVARVRTARWHRWPARPGVGERARSRSTRASVRPTSLSVRRERLGGRPRLGLDAGAGRRRDRLPDGALHHGHHHRRPGHPRSVGGLGSPVVDFQATVTEVRPGDGQEEYVTSGFLRSSNQVDRPPRPALFTAADLPRPRTHGTCQPHRYTLVKIPIDPIVHTFRPGTELRVVVSAPGGDRPDLGVRHRSTTGQRPPSASAGAAASTLVVDVVHGVTATPTLPACGSLRGEPCRAYRPRATRPDARAGRPVRPRTQRRRVHPDGARPRPRPRCGRRARRRAPASSMAPTPWPLG